MIYQASASTPKMGYGTVRPRRSVLFMPASNTRALDKARGLAADGLIFDLEDAVAPDAKRTARDNVAQALTAGGYGRRELFLRVNALTTEWGRPDLVAAVGMPLDGVLMPKVESADAVRRAEAVLAVAGAPERLAVWCMIETPLGVLRAEEIAASSPQLGGLVMGTSDLTKDLRARHTRDRQHLRTSLGLLPAGGACLRAGDSRRRASRSCRRRGLSCGLPPSQGTRVRR